MTDLLDEIETQTTTDVESLRKIAAAHLQSDLDAILARHVDRKTTELSRSAGRGTFACCTDRL